MTNIEIAVEFYSRAIGEERRRECLDLAIKSTSPQEAAEKGLAYVDYLRLSN